METKTPLLYSFLLFFSTFLHPSHSKLCNPNDLDALVKIRKAFNNPESLVSWNPKMKTDCCNWDYVNCNEDTNRVKCISFRNLHDLSGPIPREVGDLPFLETLEFTNTSRITGEIPHSIEKLTMLRFLIISLTKVSGPIPSIISNLKSLEFIDLSSNNLTGEIPATLASLPNLGALRLDRNKLSGPIPDTIGDFPVDDFYLYVSHPRLCNTNDLDALVKIKKAFNNPESLVSWNPKMETDCCNSDHVDCNEDTNRVKCISFKNLHDLSGPIPPQVGDLPFLETLEFTNTSRITGEIPHSIEKLTMLRFLVISLTKVSGPIPSIISNLKSLEFIDLSSNNLTGEIPASIASLPYLGALRLDRNKLSGPIPDNFGDFPVDDFYLYVSYNQLSGKIPSSMERKDFTYIDIQENRLEGDVAPLFKSTKKMQFADMSGNLLKFDLSDVDFPKTLVYLDLSENMVYGALPEELTELPSLRHFNVSYNRLCGKIPVGGNLQKFGESAYKNNICLCGSPLPSCEWLRDIFVLSKCFLRCMFSKYDF